MYSMPPRRPSLPIEIPSDDALPSSINGYVSVRGKQTVFKEDHQSAAFVGKTTIDFHAKRADRDSVRKTLERGGFRILAESPLGIAVSGAPAAYEQITNGRLVAVERLTRAERGRTRYVTNLDVTGRGQPKELGVATPESASLKRKVDGILLERPQMPMSIFPSPIPPTSVRSHLRLPGDVAVGLSATNPHRSDLTGQDVFVVMPDTGWFRHPYFTANHYQVDKPITVVAGTNANEDPIGHGTGESANLFAVAPGARLQPIRASDNNGSLVGAIASFLKAKELTPKIITCSWGNDSDYPPDNGPSQADRAFALEIQHAIESGICVVFSAGNGQFSIQPQVPGVLAAGGVYMTPTLELMASNYASGYESPWYPGRIVPDVCGLVGMLPRAQYLMLPVPPGCQLDEDESKPDSTDPQGDGTDPNDGWALFSGTSAAAPQLAGAAAVLLGVNPKLTPKEIVAALTSTAIDITTGTCFPRFNNLATPGQDKATGFGLVNLAAAVAQVQKAMHKSG
jgi:subtilisin family serine protease